MAVVQRLIERGADVNICAKVCIKSHFDSVFSCTHVCVRVYVCVCVSGVAKEMKSPGHTQLSPLPFARLVTLP